MSLYHAFGNGHLPECRGKNRPLHLPLHKIPGTKKLCNSPVSGAIKEPIRAVKLAQLPINDQRNTVGKNDSLLLVMRDKDRRDAKLFL